MTKSDKQIRKAKRLYQRSYIIAKATDRVKQLNLGLVPIELHSKVKAYTKKLVTKLEGSS